MEEILYIEAHKVDLRPNTITRTLQINDIGDAKDRQANYSNTIKLPWTANNVRIFDFLGIDGNTSLAPYRKLHCRYVVNGATLILNGYAVVRAVVPGVSFDVVLYDGIIDLAERIKGRSLRDLNYSDLNHYLTQSTYEDSLQNTEGYIYALGEFMPRPYFLNVQINEQAPSVFVKTIWDKIFTEAGLSYSGTFFEENTDFQSEVITPTIGYKVENIELDSTTIGTGGTNTITRIATTSDPLYFLEDTFVISGSYPTSDGSITIPQDGQYTVNLDIDYTNNQNFVSVRLMLAGRMISIIMLDRGGDNVQKSINFTANAGDVLSLVIRGTYDISQESPYYINYSASSNIELYRNTGGQFIDFATFVADLDQLAFVKDVMQRYGLILRSVRYTDDYEFTTFEELLNDRQGAEDWSDKLSHITGERYNVAYARRNYATYSYPEEIVERIYNGVLTIDNENINNEKNLFASPYEIPTNRPRNFKGMPIYQAHLWEEAEEDGEPIIKEVETPAKIFRIGRVDTSITTHFFDDANTITIEGNIPFLTLKNMEMQYFLNRYYKAFKNLVERAKQIDAALTMTELDIYNLDFFKLKFLGQTGKYYYLNNLKHTPGKVAKGELIQLNGFSVNLPPTVLGVFEASLMFQNTRSITIQNITEQTNPAYFDPEFDEPMAIMITGGFNNNILIKNGSEVLTTQTEIPVESWALQIEDAGNLLQEHNANFTFRIKDKGSEQWSEVEGTIAVSVAEYLNQPPVAVIENIPNLPIPENEFTSIAQLSGVNSQDSTGEITGYAWTIVSKPANSEAVIQNHTQVNAALAIPNQSSSLGNYTVRLTVTDEFGATGTTTEEFLVFESSIVDPQTENPE